ncbi:MAG: hypothetical protein KAT20_08175, partial [Desulfuromonadales bacterium]|nr:hypothetical protein [Desulfuromonadales bacterium]
MAYFEPESVAQFAPELVAYFGAEQVAQFGPEYAFYPVVRCVAQNGHYQTSFHLEVSNKKPVSND